MEGKAVLFKRFADVDVFDIEVNSSDPEEIVRFVEMIAPTFGGINLEDIKAPECFYIEQEAQKRCDIPVFHDDQHGTAIISGAGLINALEIVGKKFADVAWSSTEPVLPRLPWPISTWRSVTLPSNIIMCDTKGVIYKGRVAGINEYKERYAGDTPLRTLAEALIGADVFIGLSVKDVLTREMVRSMAADPVIFAMANPDPEITFEEVAAVRERHHLRHRAHGLPEPDEQCPRLSLYLPRRARRAGPHHQHGDEDRRRARALADLPARMCPTKSPRPTGRDPSSVRTTSFRSRSIHD